MFYNYFSYIKEKQLVSTPRIFDKLKTNLQKLHDISK